MRRLVLTACAGCVIGVALGFWLAVWAFGVGDVDLTGLPVKHQGVVLTSPVSVSGNGQVVTLPAGTPLEADYVTSEGIWALSFRVWVDPDDASALRRVGTTYRSRAVPVKR